VFKNKLFLYGFGIGLIFAALLLQLMNYTDDPSNTDVEDSIQLEAVEDWDALFIEHLDNLTNAAERNGYQIISEKEEVSPEQTSNIDPSTADSDTPAEEELLTEPNGEVLFTITSGMGSNEVAKQLHEMKLIQDIEEFIEVMNNRQLNSRIQIGSYRFEGFPEMDKLIEKITSS
jgi:hypothetical protein